MARCIAWMALILQPPIREVTVERVLEIPQPLEGLLGWRQCYNATLREEWKAGAPPFFSATIAWIETKVNWCTNKVPDTDPADRIRYISSSSTSQSSWVWWGISAHVDIQPVGSWDDCLYSWQAWGEYCFIESSTSEYEFTLGGPSTPSARFCRAHLIDYDALGNRTEHAQWWDVPGLGCGQ